MTRVMIIVTGLEDNVAYGDVSGSGNVCEGLRREPDEPDRDAGGNSDTVQLHGFPGIA